MSQTRFFKSVITPTLVQPTENHEAGVASGMWSLQDQARARRGGVWPEAGVTNPDTLVENVFSTFLYTGTGSNITINNGIDLANDGGLVWYRRRDGTENNSLEDTVRGLDSVIYSDSANAAADPGSYGLQAFNSNGFTAGLNTDQANYVSWTFKKASKFFDVVTYTGNGTSGRTVSHNLGAVPGMMIVKHVSQSDHWMVYHRGLGNTKYMNLSLTHAEQTASSAWNDTDPTATEFTLGNAGSVNQNGSTYVAYLFGHDTSSDGMIQCGSVTTSSSFGTLSTVDLGFEPQFLMLKSSSHAVGWEVYDTMRDFGVTGHSFLYWNTTAAEASNSTAGYVQPTSTGFQISSDYWSVNNSLIYMAIRRGLMATPTAASSVFDIQNSTTNNPAFTSNNIIDTAMFANKGSSDNRYWSFRLGHRGYLYSNATNAEATNQAAWDFGDSQFGHYHNSGGLSGYIGYFWRRAPGYHDVVAYTGTGSARTVAHNLGVVPEMMWVKRRNNTGSWNVFHTALGNTKASVLNATDGSFTSSDFWNNTSPTSSVFTVGTGTGLNGSGDTYVAYLFATLAGVSKVGSVSHSGSSTDVDCGFSSGASLVMLKRTDSTGDWYWWDSTSGIVSGNDPYILLNTNAAQVTNTDLIDPLSSGFTITGDFTDGDYIFYAIAAI